MGKNSNFDYNNIFPNVYNAGVKKVEIIICFHRINYSWGDKEKLLISTFYYKLDLSDIKLSLRLQIPTMILSQIKKLPDI